MRKMSKVDEAESVRRKFSEVDEAESVRRKFSEEYWKPVTENNEISEKEFDQRFPIDRTYQIDYPNFMTKEEKTRIRFVKHPDCGQDEVKICRTDIRISKPISRWLGGGMITSGLYPGKKLEYRAAKLTNSSEKIMKIKDVEERYGIKLTKD